MINMERYTATRRKLWDDFVAAAKNGVFLFNRRYMEYHADRFVDHSLMFFDRQKLLAVFPANISDDCCISHGGLTYGGVVCDSRMKTVVMLEIFNDLIKYLRAHGITKLIYKPVPHIYHRLPAEEDLYALFRCHATLQERQVSSTVYAHRRPAYAKGRKACINKSRHGNLGMREMHGTDEFNDFWQLMTTKMRKKYQTTPTHNAHEMIYLKLNFLQNIRLFGAYAKAGLVAGVLIYETHMTAHCQYIAASDEGQKQNALDFLIDRLLNDVFVNKPCFDWGTSIDEGILNNHLILNKESFGGRAICYDSYEILL